MKGINAIENANDPGKDGIIPATGTNPNLSFAKDLTAFSLEYFNNDYSAINQTVPFASVEISSHAANNSSALYNGNIRYMQTRLTNPTTGEAMPMLNAYQYDQLNRLKESRSYESGLSSNIWNPVTYGNEYYNAFDFDAMGNILHQDRHLRDGTKIENMTYQYQYEDPLTKQRLMRNRLYHINDDIASSVNTTDIDDMGTFDADIEDININNNYSYDEEGRLVKDAQEGISKIVWRVDGKVKEIQRVTGDKKWLRFDYDAMGHRIAKHVYANNSSTLERSTYYILDAQGNQISTYDHEVVSETAQFNLKERNIFGSSRIGSKQDSMNVLTATLSQNITQILGLKYYEFSNHLGNVLTVYNDVKIALDVDADNVVDGYGVPIRNIADYSPFGVALDGRTVSLDNYRYGYQGSEKDDETKGCGNSYTTFFRQLDPRVGRWFSEDPKYKALESPYVSMGNSPTYKNDVLGDTDSPIFDENGKMLGTDDEGVKGVPIIMDKKDFTQGMSHKDATEKDLGFGKLKSKHAVKRIVSFLKTVKLRPDYDGQLTLDEVEDWYANKTGKPLYVDASKLDLSPIEKKDLKVNKPTLINYAFTVNTTVGLVYGRIYLTLLDKKGNVKVGMPNGKIDTYDFDSVKYSENGSYKDHAKTFARNTLTTIGKMKAGDGKGFDIYVYKLGKVK